MQIYDVMVLYKPLLMEDLKNKTISKIRKFIESKKGKMTEVDNIGKRMLAYPIKKFDEGHYVRYDIELGTEDVKELKREMELMEDVLRFLIIKK